MANKIREIGIIGCGTIGEVIALAITTRFSAQAKLSCLCDQDIEKTKKLATMCNVACISTSIDEAIERSDLIVECASGPSAYEIAKKSLSRAKDVLVMSVGGILDRSDEIFSLADKMGASIYIPSGALCGIDAVKAAGMAKIKKATLTTRKPPNGLAGAPYLEEHNIDISSITEETVIFQGNALEAIKGFPKNVNVCAILSLAGIGAKETTVKIITSPLYKSNSHEVELEGDFGILRSSTENVPSPSNPKTSFLASLSAVATLNTILSVVKIGT